MIFKTISSQLAFQRNKQKYKLTSSIAQPTSSYIVVHRQPIVQQPSQLSEMNSKVSRNTEEMLHRSNQRRNALTRQNSIESKSIRSNSSYGLRSSQISFKSHQRTRQIFNKMYHKNASKIINLHQSRPSKNYHQQIQYHNHCNQKTQFNRKNKQPYNKQTEINVTSQYQEKSIKDQEKYKNPYYKKYKKYKESNILCQPFITSKVQMRPQQYQINSKISQNTNDVISKQKQKQQQEQFYDLDQPIHQKQKVQEVIYKSPLQFTNNKIKNTTFVENLKQIKINKQSQRVTVGLIVFGLLILLLQAIK